MQLIDTREIWISAWVDETAIAALEVGQPVRVVFRSEADRNYSGEVARLGREADRETREFMVDVRVQQLPVNWAVGLSGPRSLLNPEAAGMSWGDWGFYMPVSPAMLQVRPGK